MDAPPVAVEERSLRDSFGTFENVVTSEHFAVKWGDELEPDADDVAIMLEGLEHAWTVEMEDLGFPAPTGTDAWYLNVYVGSSGDPARPLARRRSHTLRPFLELLHRRLQP